jgi:hypothetical protein
MGKKERCPTRCCAAATRRASVIRRGTSRRRPHPNAVPQQRDQHRQGAPGLQGDLSLQRVLSQAAQVPLTTRMPLMVLRFATNRRRSGMSA